MLGAIIGDIVGSRWEFNPTNDYNFEWLSDKTLANTFMNGAVSTLIQWGDMGAVSLSG